MTEQQFTELLIKLKIPSNNRSYGDLYELLDAKLSEYIDRQDAASQEVINDIQDALDYAEIKKNEAGSGIALKPKGQFTNKEADLDLKELAAATREVGESTSASPVTSGTQQPMGERSPVEPGLLWFFSLEGAANINTMFYQAVDDLKYGEFDHANSIFEAILNQEPNNASAYLGRAMAKQRMKDISVLGRVADPTFFDDVNMRRAFDHGNEHQKRYLSNARQNAELIYKYKEADKRSRSTNDTELIEAANMFRALGDYRDAAQRVQMCDKRREDLKKQKAESREKEQLLWEYNQKMQGFYNSVHSVEQHPTLGIKFTESYYEAWKVFVKRSPGISNYIDVRADYARAEEEIKRLKAKLEQAPRTGPSTGTSSSAGSHSYYTPSVPSFGAGLGKLLLLLLGVAAEIGLFLWGYTNSVGGIMGIFTTLILLGIPMFLVGLFIAFVWEM